MFTIRGDRLGYSNGIIILGVASIILIVAFQGQTEHLIPLYAVGYLFHLHFLKQGWY